MCTLLCPVRFSSNNVALKPVDQPPSAGIVDDMEEMTELKLVEDDITEDLFADTGSEEEEDDDETLDEPVHGVSVDECFVLDMDSVDESCDEHESDEYLFHSFSANQTASEVLSALVERVSMLVDRDVDCRALESM